MFILCVFFLFVGWRVNKSLPFVFDVMRRFDRVVDGLVGGFRGLVNSVAVFTQAVLCSNSGDCSIIKNKRTKTLLVSQRLMFEARAFENFNSSLRVLTVAGHILSPNQDGS